MNERTPSKVAEEYVQCLDRAGELARRLDEIQRELASQRKAVDALGAELAKFVGANIRRKVFVVGSRVVVVEFERGVWVEAITMETQQ